MSIKHNNDSFIEKCIEIHGSKYDYSLVQYQALKLKVDIVCPKHGIFTQRAQAHMNGQNCPDCYNESRNISKIDFIRKSNEVHNFKYTYFDFISLKKKITINCKKHGDFLQMPYRHLKGQGCAKCARESHRIHQTDFIKRSSLIHNFIYDYSKVNYINHSTKVTIICKKHGEFEQTPNNHMTQRKGCKKCSKVISKMETEWLDGIGVPDEFRQYKVKINGKRYIVDGIDLVGKIIYEFYGDYWHGNINIYNPEDYNKTVNKKFDELYSSTIKREKMIKESGFEVVTIWESDFLKK